MEFPTSAEYPRLTRSVLKSLSTTFRNLQRDREVQGVVIRANEKSFAIGADIQEVSQLSAARGREFALEGQALCDRLASFPFPVVAAIRGFCLGGGLDLALACHARVATFDATFGHPGGALGLITGWGGTQRLPRLIGKTQALQVLLTGERIPATQALTLGLVDELVAGQDLTSAAVRICGRLKSMTSGAGS